MQVGIVVSACFTNKAIAVWRAPIQAPYALLAQSGLEQWVSTPRVGSSNLSEGAKYAGVVE